jgi:hypothetical protein
MVRRCDMDGYNKVKELTNHGDVDKEENDYCKQII